MSSMYDTHVGGEVQYQQFPSEASNGRLLCVKGHDKHDGAWNSYALAWPETLPYNATLMKGLTFVSNNHYNYDNIWHGLSAVVPFVAWHIKNGCSIEPTRWVLYHWGELRTHMGLWVRSLMEATFSGPIDMEGFDHGARGGSGGGSSEEEEGAVCFEEAVVMRHNEGGMSRQRRVEVYDLMRCKAREYCNVSLVEGGGRQRVGEIGMTMLMRTGPRSFRNQSAVVDIFQRECRQVEGCQLRVAHSNNLTFCEQVKLMSLTDILVSPHGAQLTNMFLMDRNSSVMEFFPKGWLKLAGVGQYVYHWIASWSGMNHRGAWRDPDGDQCPYGDADRRCMSIYKNGLIGYNETFFAEWARNVVNDVKVRKMEKASKKRTIVSPSVSG
ncbi:Protein O-linked-mannose beta-1,4-N-acetylglucosaminyltransferase, partial [Actinidia chinensis var. chinensis]